MKKTKNAKRQPKRSMVQGREWYPISFKKKIVREVLKYDKKHGRGGKAHVIHENPPLTYNTINKWMAELT